MFAKSGALEPAVADAGPARRGRAGAARGRTSPSSTRSSRSPTSSRSPRTAPMRGRAQPIELLQPTALALPLPWLVDRYVGLLAERQRVISRLIDQRRARRCSSCARTTTSCRPRGGSRTCSRAPAGPARSIATSPACRGIGLDRELAARAEIVAENPTAEAYVELAERAARPTSTPRTRPPRSRSASPGSRGPRRAEPARRGRRRRARARPDRSGDRALRGGADATPARSTPRSRCGSASSTASGSRGSRAAAGPRAASEAWRDVLRVHQQGGEARTRTRSGSRPRRSPSRRSARGSRARACSPRRGAR